MKAKKENPKIDKFKKISPDPRKDSFKTGNPRKISPKRIIDSVESDYVENQNQMALENENNAAKLEKSIQKKTSSVQDSKEYTMSMYFWICSSLFSVIAITYRAVIHNVQPEPFVDEIFHVRQAERYCNGDFYTYDPKLTTPPGLYMFTLGLKPLVKLFMRADMCTLSNFRLLNVGIAHLNHYLIKEILMMKNLNLDKSQEMNPSTLYKVMVMTFNISLFPIMLFMSSLYYTETLSTAMVLLMYLLHQRNYRFVSAAIGLFSIVVRQTNIIWVGYLMSEDIYTDIAPLLKKLLRRRQGKYIKYFRDLLFTYIKNDMKKTLEKISAYICLGVLFAIFILVNGGIVIGDKSAHVATIHLPQMFYFSSFTLFFSAPYFLKTIAMVLANYRFFNINLKDIILTLALIILCSIIVKNNTLVHPYLLADNRHYTFYIWKRFYEQYVLFRYFMIPLYMLGFYHIIKTSSFKNPYLFLFFVSLALIPQTLLDLRYFIIPYVIYRLNMKLETLSWSHIILDTLFTLGINSAALVIFVMKEFKWSDSDSIQRIMW